MRQDVERIFADPRIRRAFQFIQDQEPKVEADHIRLTQIPAPPFNEGERAQALAADFRRLDFQPVMDAIGNVIVAYDRFGPNPVVIGAHLDTVFPASTPLVLKRKGRVLHMPGISDNGSGLAALLWVLRAARESGLRFRRPVIALGNVGEEGEGNLRGVRHLFNAPPWESGLCDFIAVDTAGIQRITHRALGSRRFRVRFTGPGGHSWADFGRPNPIHALVSAMSCFTQAGLEKRPETTFNVGVIRGGFSVNAIPTEALAEVDLRSVSPSNLAELDDRLRGCVAQAASSAGVDYQMKLMGDRPTGKTPVHLPIVQAAIAVTRHFGIEPLLDVGSTDANLPISLGVPAIAIGAGGSSGNIHTPEEWFDPTYRHLGLQRLLALVATLAGLE